MTRELNKCPKCIDIAIIFHIEEGYWECLQCNHTWGYLKDDPDYEELELCNSCEGRGFKNIGKENIECQFCGGRGLF